MRRPSVLCTFAHTVTAVAMVGAVTVPTLWGTPTFAANTTSNGAAPGAVPGTPRVPAPAADKTAIPARDAGCVPMNSYSVTRSQTTDTLRYWTTARTDATQGFSQAAVGNALRALKRPLPLPKPVQQCMPAVGPGQEFATNKPSGVSAPATQRIDGYPTVGKLFFRIGSVARLNCTGSVINDAGNNPKQELMLTAAHCFEGVFHGAPYRTNDWMFAPMWHDNKFPKGKWSIRNWYVDRRWFHCSVLGCHENPRYDYAVAILRPQHGHGVGWYTGENGWRVNAPKVINVRIVGIPGNSLKALVNVTRSQTITIKPGGYLARRASTPGFTEGSSGGPWFYSFDTHTQLGSLLGVIGGYQDGGSSSSGSPSYASYWTMDFAALVATAAQHE